MNRDKKPGIQDVPEPSKLRLFPGDIVQEIANRSGLPKVVIRLVVHHFLAEVSDQLADGREFVLPGVGTVFRYWLEPPGPLRPRLQLRFRPSEKLRRALQLYQ
ncbi:MAG: HU family DNA-binding protein [Actinobacteria bacterium]|nr:HU family DNA-binding protein [Actinomycetota bacterium]